MAESSTDEDPFVKQARIEEEQCGPLTVDDLIEILGSTVKHDDDNKAIAFLDMLLTYTEEDQTNIGFLAESSTGKSYIPLQLSWYFPKEDVIKLGYASPQTFFYETGLLIPDPTDERDVEPEKRRKIRVVDLHQKILVFMDQPHDQLLQRLRSLLSHDEKEIVSKLVNRREKSGNRTETVIIKGYPTVLFCTARFTMQEQEKTRLLLLSPEVNQEKLRETLVLKIHKESDRESYQKSLDKDPKRRFLSNRVQLIKQEQISFVNIPEEYREQIYKRFSEQHKFLIPRHQRDISRLLSIIKGHALLNFKHRKHVGFLSEDREELKKNLADPKQTTIIANLEDVDAGFKLYNSVSEANELGLSPELYNVYQKLRKYFEDSEIGILRKDFQKSYFKEFHKTLGQKTATSILEALINVDLLREQPDPNDRRYMRYIPSDMGVTSEKQHTVENQYLVSEDQQSSPLVKGYLSHGDSKEEV